MNLQVCIMTPDKIFWDEEAEEIILRDEYWTNGCINKTRPFNYSFSRDS